MPIVVPLRNEMIMSATTPRTSPMRPRLQFGFRDAPVNVEMARLFSRAVRIVTRSGSCKSASAFSSADHAATASNDVQPVPGIHRERGQPRRVEHPQREQDGREVRLRSSAFARHRASSASCSAVVGRGRVYASWCCSMPLHVFDGAADHFVLQMSDSRRHRQLVRLLRSRYSAGAPPADAMRLASPQRVRAAAR